MTWEVASVIMTALLTAAVGIWKIVPQRHSNGGGKPDFIEARLTILESEVSALRDGLQRTVKDLAVATEILKRVDRALDGRGNK